MSWSHITQGSPWTPELQNRVIALQEQGLSRSKIASQLDMTKNQITGWLDRRAHPERATYAWRVLGQRDSDYDGPATLDRLQAYHDKMDAALAECNSIPRIAVTPR
jgi:hypothetical protein